MPVAGRMETFHEHSKHLRTGKSQTYFLTKRIVKGIILHTENTHHYGGDYYVCPAEELDLILSVGINLTQLLLLLRGWMMESLRKKVTVHGYFHSIGQHTQHQIPLS